MIPQHTDNLIILGTRLWSQKVDVSSRDPVKGKNLAYTIHFYAGMHRRELRVKVRQALANGIAIFATVWLMKNLRLDRRARHLIHRANLTPRRARKSQAKSPSPSPRALGVNTERDFQ